jgi:DNA-binding GntR family transcriptional regulator
MSRKATLADVLADSLRQALRDGTYTCGDRLAEAVIAREMSVSQNTARDALRILESEGWLRRLPRRGMIVYHLTADDAADLFAIRVSLETLALQASFRQLDERIKRDLAGHIEQARLQVGTGDLRAVLARLITFHWRLVTLAAQPLLTETLTPILNRSHLLANLRSDHDPDDQRQIAHRLTDYGTLITHIRYENRVAAQTTLTQILHHERDSLMVVLDLVQ